LLESKKGYLDGELSQRHRCALEAHLETCGDCAAELTRAKGEWELLTSIGSVPPLPADLQGLVLHTLEESSRMPWHKRRQVQVFRAACLAACAVLGVASGALLSWRGGQATGGGPAATAPFTEKKLVDEVFDAHWFGLGEPMEGGLFRCGPR
jgi:anti-sigma factor RsiW